MKLLIIPSAFFSFILFSCKKDANTTSSSNSERLDSAVSQFVTATKITDEKLTVSLDSLVKRARRHGWWELCNAIYPFAGGTSETCKYNLKDPRDLDAAFRLTFLNNPAVGTAGVTFDGSTQYADTHLTPSSTLSLNDTHFSIYVPSSGHGGNHGITGDVHPSPYFEIEDADTTQGWVGLNSTSDELISYSNTDKYFLLSRTGPNSSDISLYHNSTQTGGLSQASSALPTVSVYLGAANDGTNNPTQFSADTLQFVSIGSGINATMASAMYTDIFNFVTSKGY
jgi:hypothetical protein